MSTPITARRASWRRARNGTLVCIVASAQIGCLPRATTQAVTIRAFAFSPSADTVRVGDTLVWRNRDLVPHTATARDETFDSGSLEADAWWRLIARTPGVYPYICTFHPAMAERSSYADASSALSP
ncbi:MAG: cupredoxin family copper-binding protein [Gemmatimonadaceae bacterium]